MRDPLKVRWYHIKERCYNKNSKSYPLYGGRGITVCDEWLHDSDAFARWAMENGYKSGLEIDRIDNDKGYSPDNCRWIPKIQNMRNTRINKNITWNGKTHTLSEWCELLDLPYQTINMRLHRGWSFEDAISRPIRNWNDESGIIGKRFGRLIVKSVASNRTSDGHKQYICLCDCGKECVVTGRSLRKSKTKSCGCLQSKFPGFKPYRNPQ